MRKRILVVPMAVMLAAGCSAPSGPDSTLDKPTDAAPTPSDGEPLTDARSTTADADVSAPVDARAEQTPSAVDSKDAGDGGLAADATGLNDAGSAATRDGGDAGAREGGDAQGGDPETGRLVGITAAHNAVRAAVQTTPPLPPLVWSQTIADYAQQWATSLATSMCAQPQHRSSAELAAKNYGENLAAFGSGGVLQASSTAQQAVNGWAAESACWTYGTIQGTEKCNVACYTNLHSDGCGHYTQIVWRGSTQLGCGVASCKNGSSTEDIWICNYAPPGNFVGRAPY